LPLLMMQLVTYAVINMKKLAIIMNTRWYREIVELIRVMKKVLQKLSKKQKILMQVLSTQLKIGGNKSQQKLNVSFGVIGTKRDTLVMRNFALQPSGTQRPLNVDLVFRINIQVTVKETKFVWSGRKRRKKLLSKT